jgi:hypothetical protein
VVSCWQGDQLPFSLWLAPCGIQATAAAPATAAAGGSTWLTALLQLCITMCVALCCVCHNMCDRWHCFEDRCPHRLAPLSEGRLEPTTGNLMCSYHGESGEGGGRGRSLLCKHLVAATACSHASGPGGCWSSPRLTVVLSWQGWPADGRSRCGGWLVGVRCDSCPPSMTVNCCCHFCYSNTLTCRLAVQWVR